MAQGVNIGGDVTNGESGLSGSLAFSINSDGTGGVTQYVQINLKITLMDSNVSNISHIGFVLERVYDNNTNTFGHMDVCDVMDQRTGTEQTLIGFITTPESIINELTNQTSEAYVKYAIKIKYKRNTDNEAQWINTVFVLADSQLGMDFTNSNINWNDTTSLPYITTKNNWDNYVNNTHYGSTPIEDPQNVD